MDRRGMAAVAAMTLTLGCGTTGTRSAATKASAAAGSLKKIDLPGAPPTGGVFMDYLAYDRAHHRVWVPAGSTGSVDVIDADSGQVHRVEGFVTAEMERKGHKRVVGPSSATVGDGVVYVGNRGDSSVCAVDAATLQKGACVKLDSMPDGIAWVASAKEVWVTTPRDKSITIIDAANGGTLAVKTKISFEGEPEGYAVDDARGLFYTNLEDKDRTLAIDVKAHQLQKTWMPNCGEDGPKGLALDHERNFLVVACADRVKVLDAGQDGKELSMVATGDGVDNIYYVEARHAVYAAAARAAKLTVAVVDAAGKLQPQLVVATINGARNGVVADDGATYLTDSPEGKIVVIPAARH